MYNIIYLFFIFILSIFLFYHFFSIKSIKISEIFGGVWYTAGMYPVHLYSNTIPTLIIGFNSTKKEYQTPGGSKEYNDENPSITATREMSEEMNLSLKYDDLKKISYKTIDLYSDNTKHTNPLYLVNISGFSSNDYNKTTSKYNFRHPQNYMHNEHKFFTYLLLTSPNFDHNYKLTPSRDKNNREYLLDIYHNKIYLNNISSFLENIIKNPYYINKIINLAHNKTMNVNVTQIL